MRESLLGRLRCPRCRAEDGFVCAAGERDEREIVRATLTCRSCGHEAAVRDGIVDLLHDPPAHVVREARGLERFAEAMRNDGWTRERVVALPDDELGYWKEQRRAVDRMLARVELRPGAVALDVGSNTCWASNLLARRGLDVIALDIADVELQGLRTARWFFEAHDVYFERVLSSMAAPAIATGTIDVVFCSQVLHHNDRAQLRTTLGELFRVLRPGGRLLAINEPLRFLNDLKRETPADAEEFEGHEHVYFAWEYARAARRAGFAVEVLPPHWPMFAEEIPWPAGTSPRKARLLETRAGRALMLAKARLLGPDHSLALIATKPG